MKKFTLIITVLAITMSCSKDDQLITYRRDGDEIFDTMAKLEDLRGVDTFIGNLKIQGRHITSLEDLRFLKTIKGSLMIQLTTELEDLEGLNNLRTVEGIDIFHNDQLSNIDALSGISETEYIKFKTNPLIASLDGLGLIQAESVLISFLPELTSIGDNITIINNEGGNISVTDCDKLTSIGFLDDIKSAEYVWLSKNPLLEVPNAFSNLEELDQFYLEACGKITSVNLSSLTLIDDVTIFANTGLQQIFIGGDTPITFADFESPEITIIGNGSLKTIDGFNGFTKAFIHISSNALLESLTGFNAVATGSLTIQQNPTLNEINIFNQSTVELSELNFIGNTSLNDFCGLNNALSGLNNAVYLVEDNLYNPTKEMLIDGVCSSD